MMPDTRTVLSTKLAALARQLRHLPRALRLVVAAAGLWAWVWLALLVVQGLIPVAIVYLTRDLVNSLAQAVRSGVNDLPSFAPTLWLAAAMGGLVLLGELLRGATDWVKTIQAKQVEDHVSALIHAKSTTVDLAFYESAEFHDHLHRARDEATYRPVALLENAGSLVQNSITLVAMALVLIPYGWWMSAALVVSTVPAFLVVMRFAIRQHQWRMRVTEDERRSHYYSWMMTSGDTAAELRLFGLGGYFQQAYSAIRARLRREQFQLVKQQGLADFAASAIALIVVAACLAWMAWRAAAGLVTLGDLALFYQAFSQGQRLMRSLLGSVGQFYSNVLFLGNLFEFLDLKETVVDPVNPTSLRASVESSNVAPTKTSLPPGGGERDGGDSSNHGAANHITPLPNPLPQGVRGLTQQPAIAPAKTPLPPGGGGAGGEGEGGDSLNHGAPNHATPLPNPLPQGARGPAEQPMSPMDIRFNNVSFCYPGTNRIALDGVNLTIPSGQIAAIVGTNGAGKSTLLKLLCRFYDPQSGSVQINGTDVREYGLADLRSAISVLFQQPVHYQATVAENISLQSQSTVSQRAEIEAAAHAAGAADFTARLPNGFDTHLGKWFGGGVDLSVGEWQRIALARAFLRKAPIMILDEPTSAMDSWAEADWIARFRSLAQGRTTIIITHRFTTAMQADVIHVMDKGKIVESGTHRELLALGKSYSISWRAQMQAEQTVM